MKKILILTISLLGTLGLAGCGVKNIKVNFHCEGGSAHATSCEGGVSGTFKKSTSDELFDANLASIDLSTSSVSVTTTTGTLVVNVKNSSGVTIASSVFNWYSVGDELYPSNPSIMSDWVNANALSNYDVTYEISGIDTSGQYGDNSFTAIFRYGANSVGASSGFYLNNSDLNGF